MENKPDVAALEKYSFNLIEQNKSDYKCAELYFEKSKYINIEVEENSIKNSELGSEYGVSIRIIGKKGALGFAITNNIEKKSIERMVNNAIKMMKCATNDSDFIDLPSNYSNYPSIKDLFDPNIKSIQIENSLNDITDLIKICKEDELAISQSAEFSATYTKTNIFNTNGIELSGKNTICTIVSNMIVKDKVSKETSYGYDWQSVRSLKEIDAQKIAKSALKNAKSNLNRIKIKNMKCPLILTPNGTISLILSSIASAVNANAYQYNRSFLVDQKDKILGSKYLNIEDNALIDGAAGSAFFDGEGVPCKNKTIFENGKFLKTGLLHNSYTAGKDGIESTGNAARHSFNSIPSIGISNFILKPGDFTQEEIIKDVKEGILLKATGDSPNISTGDFSGLILQGNYIKNGEIKEPLNETMFAFNLLDAFKKIEAVSKEFKVYGSYIAPYVKISEVQIIGAAQ